tara:strand:+ start:272 stop:649 length:378 start_codon:yes stop_codon:yes gene_type:complete
MGMSRHPFTFVKATTGISPVHPIHFDHHSTITFKPSADAIRATPFGTVCTFKVVGIVITDKVHAAVISFTSGIKDSDISSGCPHITISCARGVAPFASVGAIKAAKAIGSIIPSTTTATFSGIVS